MNSFLRLTFPGFTLPLAFAALALTAMPTNARPPVPIAHPAQNQRLKWDSKKFMHVSELRPGMRGYALTVFKGTKIEKFGIEILGVVAKFNEGKDYILFRALDGPSVTRGLGIAHGMSGSPIYIQGRLVGAISMGIPGTQFAKDPIALATPIEAMFDAWSPDLPKKPSDLSAAPPAGTNTGANKSETRNFQPLDIPLMVSGMNARSLARLSDRLAPFHFDVMAGGGMGANVDTNPLAKGATLVPGSAVGVSLVQGDMDLTATGTVTYRDGSRLLLFGHPFTSLGPIDAALTTAYVVSIFPSYQDSIKIGSPIKTVGRIFQDRPFSVGAVIGPQPQMVPMTISVDDQSIKRREDFHVRIINHPLLTGQFVSQIADAAIAQVHGQPGDSMATVTFDVDAEEIGHIKRTNTYYDALSIDQTAIGDLDNLMRLLSSNPFYPLAVKSVKMNVTIQNRHDTAEIDHLFLKQSKFAPGDTVEVGVVLKPYKQPLYTRMISVKIPQSVADGVLPLSIRSGGSDGGGGTTSLLGGLLQIRTSDPLGSAYTVSQLVKQFTEKAQNNQLVAHLTLPTSAVTLKGEKLTGLPPTLSSAMQSTRTTGLRTERDEVKETQTVPYIVSGSQTLSITVQRKNLSEPSQSTPSVSSSASAGSAEPPASPSPGGSASPLSNGGDDSSDDAVLLSADSLAKAPAPLKSAGKETEDASSADAAATDAAAVSDDGASADDSAAAAGSTPSAVKTVGRLPSVWHQSTTTDFSAGTLKNVAVTSLGDVRLSPALQKVADTSESYIWAMLPDGKGSVYLGTGDGGMIYKMDSAGKVAPFYKTGELEVTSLALDDLGALYAGTAPHGIVFKVGPDGKGSKVFTAQEKYITALTVGSNKIYAATGGGTGRVYMFDGNVINEDRRFHVTGEVNDIGASSASRHRSANGTYSNGLSQPLFTSPEAHILSLATDRDGNVYAGSAPDGIVYKITPDGKSSVFYDAAEPNITALTTDSKGNVYAGTSTTGTVYRIAPDGTAKRLLGRSTAGITGLKTDSADTVYAAAGNTIYKIAPDDSVQSFVAPTDEQFLSLALDPAGSAVYTGTGTVGSVYKIGADHGSVPQGSFQSTIHDAGGRARWGTLDWTANTPTGTAITMQTRSGDVPRPDNSWSAWSAPYTDADGQAVTSPPARYLQYQAVFTGSATRVDAPNLRDVNVFYLPRNQPPTVGITRPASGDAVSKTASFQWTASDPDKDTLSYDVSYSSDGGTTWTPITTRARLTAQTKTKASPAGPAVSEANLSKLTDVPAGIRAQIQAQVAANAKVPVPAPAKAAQNLKETSYRWDTTQVPDGVYRIEVVASDRPSNPTGALTAKAVSTPFLITNAAPTLTLETPTVGSDKSVTLHGTAKTGPAFVKAVQAKVDGGDTVAAAADDGLFDSPSEAFALDFPGLSSGSHKIEVLVLDRAGNSVTQTVMVTVP